MSGEAWPVDFVERMEDAWGARIYEGYGASQTYGASSCRTASEAPWSTASRGLLHFYEWAALLEVLHPDTLEPVAPGEAGELVVTLLEKEASPLVRFRTRDKVVLVPHEDCACGRDLRAIEAGTISRWDDMVKIKGENVFPNEVDEIIFARPEIAEYQARVTIGEAGRDVAEIRLALAAPGPPDDGMIERLRQELKARTNITFELRTVPRAGAPGVDDSGREAAPVGRRATGGCWPPGRRREPTARPSSG